MSDNIADWRQQEVLAEMAGRVANGMDRACEFAAGRARDYAPKASGITASEIDHEVTASGMEVIGRVGVRSKRSWLARILEVGAHAHTIKASGGGVLASGGVVFGKRVKHPGRKATPFLRPAVFNHWSEIVRLICEG